MRRIVAALTLGLLLVARPAAAWWDEPDYGYDGWDVPAYDVPAPDQGPVYEAEPPEPWTVAAEKGLYRVDEVYVGSSVSTSGLRTTYSTTTASADPGTAARLIADVGAGVATGHEAELSNERTIRSDGRYVGGQLYQNFVWNGRDWEHDKYVFFQNDSELASLPAIAEPPTALVEPPRAPALVEPPRAPALETTPVTVADQPPTRDDPPAPVVREPREDPLSPPSVPTAPPAAPSASAPPRVTRAAIALAPQADTLGQIEVLRGRAVRLWMRAFVDGVPAAVTGWQLRSGEVTAIGPVGAAGEDPFVGTWERVSSASAPFVLTFDVAVSVPAEGTRIVPATIAVVVRSPAIVE